MWAWRPTCGLHWGSGARRCEVQGWLLAPLAQRKRGPDGGGGSRSATEPTDRGHFRGHCQLDPESGKWEVAPLGS